MRIEDVLIVEDEAPARKRLRDLLRQLPDIRQIRECSDGREALEAIHESPPDLLLVDLQMPDMGGIEMVQAVPPEKLPPLIFVTAHDDRAVQAFELNAVDYILKPFRDERFFQALEKVRSRVRRPDLEEVYRSLSGLSDFLRSTSGPFRKRIPVRGTSGTRFVPVRQISHFRSEDVYIRVHVGRESFLVREPLARLEESLDPRHFARIHRSSIVNLDHVERLIPGFQGGGQVELKDGSRLRVSRTYWSSLHESLEGL